MTIFTDVLIEGNSISYGQATPDGVSVVSYSYQTCIYTAADTTITDNFLTGVGSNATNNVIAIDNSPTGGGPSCLISNNKFIRGASVIGAYVVVSSVSDQIITNNFFDGYTVDGISNENLVTGLSATSTYKENKNQTGYIAIPKFPYLISSNIPNPSSVPGSEWARYTDSNSFNKASNNPGNPGNKEGISMSYTYAFVEFGDTTTGIGPFSVQVGTTSCSCNIIVPTGFAAVNGLYIRFNHDDDYYEISNAGGTGNTLFSFTLTSPTIGAVPYRGKNNANAIGRFYTSGSSPSLTAIFGDVVHPQATFNFIVDVNELLPTNVQVLNFLTGVVADSTTYLGYGTSYLSYAYASSSVAFNLLSLTGSMADVKNYTGETASGPAGTPPGVFAGFVVSMGSGPNLISPGALVASTQYLLNDISAQPSSVSNFFITGKGNVIRWNLSATAVINVPDVTNTLPQPANLNISESPLSIKYRWI